MIVVDSSVWIDRVKLRSTPQVRRLSAMLDAGQPVAITDVVYMELLRGLATRAEVAQMKLLLSQVKILRLRYLSDFERAAQLYALARRSGHIRAASNRLHDRGGLHQGRRAPATR